MILTVSKESDFTEKDLEEVQRMSRSAARDCVPQDRNSFVSFQANTGVEVWISGILAFVFLSIV